MSCSSELVAIDLSETEREFIAQVLQQWGSSRRTRSFVPDPGDVDVGGVWRTPYRLQRAVENDEPLADLDWARVMFLTQITWAGSLVGSGLDFAIVTRFSDIEAVALLRGLQRKISGYNRAKLLFPNGGRTPTAEEIENQKRSAEQLRQEQHGRRYPPGL